MGARVVGWLAVASSGVMAAVAVLVVVFSFISGADIRSAGDCESEDHPEACTTEWQGGLVGSVLFGIAGWGVMAGRALGKGAGWARRSVMVTHSLWALIVAAYFWAVAAAPEGLDASGVAVGSIMTGAFLAIVAAAAYLPRGG